MMSGAKDSIIKESFLLNSALDQIRDVIIAVDNQNRLVYLNNSAARQYNIDRKEAIGLKLTHLYRQLWFSPDDEHQAYISLKEKGAWEGVNIHLQPDGTKIVMESIINVIKNPSGERIGLLSITRNITNRVNVDSWLVESNQRLKYVVEAAGMMVYDIDTRTHEITVIRGLEELLGYSVGDVPVTIDWWISQIHPEDVSKAQEQFHPTTSVEKAVNEYRIRGKDGGYVIVRGIAKGIPDIKGNILKIIGSMQNISKEKDMERQLQQNERMIAIGQTAGMVGHDIRNPLQSIVGDLFVVKSDIEEIKNKETSQAAEEAIIAVDSISDNIDYINKIVADLQDYAKKPIPKIENAELYEVIQKGFATLKIPPNVKVQFNIEPNLKLKTDPAYIRRILTNLASNSIQAMPKGGKLIIEAKQDDKKAIELSVEDTGQGIPKEHQNKLFTPLFTTKEKGQGLGLIVVKRFVEALGGTISFESTEGKGTKFIINLPIESNQ
jgi:PAS domain S-box-containing protein